MVRVLLVLVLGVACAWVVGGFGRRVPPLLAGGLACAGGRLVGGRLGVLVVPIVSGVVVVPSTFLGSAVVGVAPVVVEGVDAVGGWRCCCDAAVGGAGDVVSEGVVGGGGGGHGVGEAGDGLVDGVSCDALGSRVLLMMVLGVCPCFLWWRLGGLLVHPLWWRWLPPVSEVAAGDVDGRGGAGDGVVDGVGFGGVSVVPGVGVCRCRRRCWGRRR